MTAVLPESFFCLPLEKLPEQTDQLVYTFRSGVYRSGKTVDRGEQVCAEVEFAALHPVETLQDELDRAIERQPEARHPLVGQRQDAGLALLTDQLEDMKERATGGNGTPSTKEMLSAFFPKF